MEDTLVIFETAKLAKEKGFNAGCDGRWYIEPGSDWKYSKQGLFKCDNTGDSIARPTQSLLQKWLRETHNINVWVSSKTTDKGNTIFIPHGRTIPDTIVKGYVKDIIVYKTFDKWEEALEFALQEALKLIK